MNGSETRDRSPAAGDDDMLTGLNPDEELGKIGLRGMDGKVDIIRPVVWS